MSSKLYQFDKEHAQKYGINEAIVLNKIISDIHADRQMESHYQFEDRTWVIFSPGCLYFSFPFWNHGQIYSIINTLINKGVLLVRPDPTPEQEDCEYSDAVLYALKNEKDFL